jgi:ketosteroid isomerase-like protein
MKKSFLIWAIVLLLCLLFGCQKNGAEGEEVSKVDVEVDIVAIEKLIQQTQDAFNAGDLDTYMASIADDAVFMPQGTASLVGKQAIRDWYNFDNMDFDSTIIIDEIEVHGDLAFARSHWDGSWVQKDIQETTLYKSQTINIFKRWPDGSWKNWRTIWNFVTRETSQN